MRKPASDGGPGERPKSAYQTRTVCPWPCLHHHVELLDAAGTVRATLCNLCDNAISRGMWLVELDRAAAGARP